VHFSEKKSRSLILPRPPTGLMRPAPGTLLASSSTLIAIKARACTAPELAPGAGVSVQPLPSAGSLLRGFAMGFALPKGDFSLGHGCVGAGPGEGHGDDPRAGAPLLQGQAEGVEAAQPGEEKAPGWP